jgi:hypothetical protein
MRDAVLSHRGGRGTVASPAPGDDAPVVMVARVSESQGVRDAEFGFER